MFTVPFPEMEPLIVMSWRVRLPELLRDFWPKLRAAASLIPTIAKVLLITKSMLDASILLSILTPAAPELIACWSALALVTKL